VSLLLQLALAPLIVVLVTRAFFDVVGGTLSTSARWRFLVITRVPLLVLGAVGAALIFVDALIQRHWWSAVWTGLAFLGAAKSIYDPPPEAPKPRRPGQLT
jgi:hypothetical protein